MKSIVSNYFRNISVVLGGWLMISFNALPAMEVRMPLMEHPPVIDGVINEDEWRDALQTVGLVDTKGFLISRKGMSWIGSDGANLFAALKTETPPHGKLIMTSTAPRTNLKAIELDDTAEIWLMPLLGDIGKAPRFHIMVNPLCSAFYLRWDPLRGSPAQDWYHHATMKSSIKEGWWHYEIAIPMSDLLGTEKPALPKLGFRLARNWTQPAQLSSSEGFKYWYDYKGTMSHLQIDPRALGVRMLSLGEWQGLKLDPQLELRNPTDQPLEIAVQFDVSSGKKPFPPQKQQLTLAAKETRVVCFQQVLMKKTEYTFSLKATSPSGQEVWYSHEFSLKTDPLASSWDLPPIAKEEDLRLDLAYSPYLNKISTRLTATGRKTAKTIQAVEFEVRAQNGSHAIARVNAGPADDQSWPAMMDVPDLKDGIYELRCRVKEKGGKENCLVKTFERKHFEWEHNRLGYADEVKPPFLPLNVKDQTVRAVYRDYHLNELGLLDQVDSEGHPLLKGPMEIQATSQGRKMVWEKTGLKFSSKKATEVVAEAAWRADRVEGRTMTRFDFDGLLTVDLELNGPGLMEIDDLKVVIPLITSEVPLMHAVGARIWGNYAGKVPAGEGSVWDNSKAMAYGYPNNFIPYLWLGGARRGLAWCADSDDGWVAKTGRPMIVIERHGETTTMTLHLISGHPKSSETRKIRFALQATPVKSRPADWRSYSFTGPYPNAKSVSLFGSGGYLGHASSFGDVYPRDRDYSFTKRILQVRKRGKTIPEDEDFLKKWVDGYRERKNIDYYSSHNREALFQMAPAAGLIIPYMHTRGTRPTLDEFHVFQDEWKMFEFGPRQWADSDRLGEILIEPVLSYQDFALWYWQKLKRLGFADGIYFDCCWLTANPNPFACSGPECVLPLKSHPTVGFNSYRQMTKRTYVMYKSYPEVETPLNLAHMTNSGVIPILSWCTLQLDWEIDPGTDDFQDRFTGDYTLASTTGEQAGTIPLVLAIIQTDNKKEATWLTRTAFGTTIVHEVKIWPAYDVDLELLKKLYGILFEFGYGSPDCQVYRYWENPPFAVKRDDVRCLLLENKGSLMLIATDYGAGGPCEVKLAPSVWSTTAHGSAVDVEKGQAVNLRKNVLKFDLPRHDFKIIRIQP